jgi:hypothetical protein
VSGDSGFGGLEDSGGVELILVQRPMPGYGAELLDPDGYRVMIWDQDTMPGYKER